MKLELIDLLKKTKPENRSQWMKFVSDDTILTLSEVLNNILFNDIGLSLKTKRLLSKKYKGKQKQLKVFEKVDQKPFNQKLIAQKRKILKQEGASLGLILATALPILSQLIFGHKN